MSALFKNDTFGNYRVSKANTEDDMAVFGLLSDTAGWLKTKGVFQWEHYLQGEGLSEVKQAIKTEITYLIETRDGKLAAMFNLSDQQNDWDIGMWGKRDDDAYYLHKLAVAKDHHGQQIGRQILDWIDENIKLENACIRLDCYADNPALNRLYQQAGYECVGHANMAGDTFSIYEKRF